MYSLSDVCINIKENILRTNGYIHSQVLPRSGAKTKQEDSMEQDLYSSEKKCTINIQIQILPGLSVLWEWYLAVKKKIIYFFLLLAVRQGHERCLLTSVGHRHFCK